VALRAGAACLAAVGLLAGCTLGAPADEEPEVPDSLTGYYAQEVDWEVCVPEGIECATVLAPLNWADPGSGGVELSIVRLAADGERLGSLLLNPGGPGISGVDFVRNSVSTQLSDTLRTRYDIVGWDLRGVSRSTPVACLDDDALDHYIYAFPVNPTGTDAWFDERADAAAEFAAACDEHTGALLGHVDAVSTARDMDLLRALLGDERLNYLGYSYGTVYGAQYAELFPERVGRVVLDAAVDPSLGVAEQLTAQAAALEGAFRLFVADCLGVGRCPFSGTVDEALAQARTLFAGVEEQGAQSDDGRRLTSATLGAALAESFYDRSRWSQLRRMIVGLGEGDAGLAFQFADGRYNRDQNGGYRDNLVAANTSASCADGTYTGGLDATRATVAAMDAVAPTVGRYLAYSDWVHLDTVCQSWPAPSVLSPAPVSADGAEPIVVVGGTDDAATPYSASQALALQLASGVLVTRVGDGHGSYGRGNACIDAAVDAYLFEGTVPADGTVC